ERARVVAGQERPLGIRVLRRGPPTSHHADIILIRSCLTTQVESRWAVPTLGRSAMTPEERLRRLCAAETAGEPIDVLAFYGHKPERDGSIGAGCLSQWWPRPFTVDGVVYATAEHWMMAAKARLFNDEIGLAEVFATPSPGAAKAAGRRVRGFDEQ